jgi:hypothetical protein
MDLDMTPDSPWGAGAYPDIPAGGRFYLDEVGSAWRSAADCRLNCQ